VKYSQHGEEKVQTTNAVMVAAKAVVGKKIPRWQHRAGSIPAQHHLIISGRPLPSKIIKKTTKFNEIYTM